LIVPRRRGGILEVSKLLDETLLWEPRCGVEELTDWVETDVDGVAERATMQGIPGQRIASRLQQCEGHKYFAQC